MHMIYFYLFTRRDVDFKKNITCLLQTPVFSSLIYYEKFYADKTTAIIKQIKHWSFQITQDKIYTISDMKLPPAQNATPSVI